jgi:hypothetical protein
MSRSTSDRAQYNAAQELENLERVFKLLDRKGDGKLDDAELLEHLKFLGFPATKSTVATVGDMIWEVDEDRDGCVSWEEFRTMVSRATALPPCEAASECMQLARPSSSAYAPTSRGGSRRSCSTSSSS